MNRTAAVDRVWRDVMTRHNLSVGKAAEVLGITRFSLVRVLNDGGAISPELAVRLEQAFGLDAESLMQLQASEDVAAARLAGVRVGRYTGVH